MKDTLFAQARGDVRLQWRAALGLHFLIQVLGFAIFAPLVTWTGRHIVLTSGEPMITNFDLVSFALSPPGVAFVLVVVALTAALGLAEFAGPSWLAGRAIARQPARATAATGVVLHLLPALAVVAARGFLRLLVLALPFLAAVALVWFTMLAGHDINYYLAEQPAEWRRAKWLVALIAAGYCLLAAWQLARWSYALPILVFERAGPGEALASSARMTRGRLGRIVPPILAWWLLLTSVAAALSWVGRRISVAAMDWAGVDFGRVLPLVALFATATILGGFLYSALHAAGHQFLLTRLYAGQRDTSGWLPPAEKVAVPGRTPPVGAFAVPAALGALALGLGVAWLAASRLDVDAAVAITAHRGASLVAPENTLAAFEAAIQAGATYAELDVQHTRDGRIVVLHDGDLMRVGGDARRLGDLDARDLATIDVGRLRAPEFAGERVPTLEEVVELVRGRMKINVELKYNVPDDGLAAAVIELLRNADFLDQAVITSLDPAALRQVKEIETGLRTGHIVTAVVGDVLRTDADFLSLNSAQATPALVRRAHAAGKEIHVWTVNRPEVMLRMIERGVDNIITDDPALLARVLQERSALSRPELLGLRLRVLYDGPPRELTDPGAVQPL